MSNKLILKDCSRFSDERVKGINISKNNFASTDSLLQNKGGIGNPVSLPNGNLISFKCDDILVGNIRPYLKKIWFSTKNGGCSPDVLVFRANSNVNPKFLYYSLFRDDFFNHMMKGAKGTKMPRGDKNQIMRFEIPKFDITDQQKIASVLSSLDFKIELNNRINAELEAMAKTIYDYWFVQFDFPDKNGKPYKTSGGKMVWNEELKREIPEGWEVKTLGEVCRIYQPQTISEKDCVEHGKYFVHGSNGIIGKYNEYNHVDSEIIVSCRGDCGNIHRTLPKMWITGNAMVFQMLDRTIHNEFLYQALRHSGIKNITSGSVQGQITKTNVVPLKIIIPDKKSLGQFSEIAINLVSKKLLLIEESQKLAELRDWLLPMLMNGQVKVGKD
jgi:type I restriction enzyme S subunit